MCVRKSHKRTNQEWETKVKINRLVRNGIDVLYTDTNTTETKVSKAGFDRKGLFVVTEEGKKRITGEGFTISARIYFLSCGEQTDVWGHKEPNQ